MKLLNIIGVVCWSILFLGCVFGILKPTRLLYGMATFVLILFNMSKIIQE